MFERMVEKFPDNIAITSKGRRLTYRELNQRANALAYFILSTPGREDDPVALLLEHDLGAVVGVMGVLKSGRPYLPLDTSYPVDRIRQIISDAGISLFIADPSNLDAAGQSLTGLGDIPLLNLDALDVSTPRANPAIRIAPDRYAFVMYTSGSTGEPKGVPSTHRHVVTTYIQEVNEWLVAPSDRISTLGMISFGMSRSTLFDALFVGGASCLFDVKRQGTNELVQWLDAQGVTMFRAQHSLFTSALSEAPAGMIFEHFRLIGIGGEVLSKTDFEIFRAHTRPDCTLASVFYSTECGAVFRNYVNHNTLLESDLLPVGYPWPDKEILLLGADGQPVAQGERGEVVVRSANLSSGYWNRPELTAEKFHSDPTDPHIKIYHTGDFGRWNSDGALEFLGRDDSMVKIRGYRVELAEVEANLHGHPAVGDVVVVPKISKVRPDTKQLVAYVVFKPGQSATRWELREYAASKLPDYMIPSFFVFLDALPLNANGKTDRRSLPDMPERPVLSEQDRPADAVEERLLKIWQKAFHLERIGVQDNFFELGGDSLLASAIFIEIEREFRRTYPLNLLLKNRTIRALARILSDPNASETSPIIALKPSGTRPPLFIFPGGVGDVLMLVGLAEAMGEDQPVYGIQAAGFFGKTVYSRRVEEVVRHFIPEIKKIQPEGPYYLAGHSFGGVIAFELARQLLEAGEQVGLLGLLDSTPPGPAQGGNFIRRTQTHFYNLGEMDWKGKLGYFTRRFQTRASKLFGRYEFFQKLLRNPAVKQVLWDDPFRQTRFAAANYAPAKPYPGVVTIYKVSERPRHITWNLMEPWKRYVSGRIEEYEVPGNHASMIKPPHVTELARVMTLTLEKGREAVSATVQ